MYTYLALTGGMVESGLNYDPGELSRPGSAPLSCVTLGRSTSLSGPHCGNLEGLGVGDVLTRDLGSPRSVTGTSPLAALDKQHLPDPKSKFSLPSLVATLRQPPMRTASASLLVFQHFLPLHPPPCRGGGAKPQASRHVQTLVLTAPPSRLLSEVSPILTQTCSPAHLSADGFVLPGPARDSVPTQPSRSQSSWPTPSADAGFSALLALLETPRLVVSCDGGVRHPPGFSGPGQEW